MKRLTDEQKRLAETHVWLADLLAASWVRKWPAHEALIRSAAALGLVDAAGRFDAALSNEFRTFAVHRIRGEIIDAIRSDRPKGFRRSAGAPDLLSMSAPLRFHKHGEERPRTVGDSVCSGEMPVGWELESEDAVKALSRKFPRRHGALIRLVHLHAAFALVRQAGAVFGVGESAASHLLCQAAEMARETATPDRS